MLHFRLAGAHKVSSRLRCSRASGRLGPVPPPHPTRCRAAPSKPSKGPIWEATGPRPSPICGYLSYSHIRDSSTKTEVPSPATQPQRQHPPCHIVKGVAATQKPALSAKRGPIGDPIFSRRWRAPPAASEKPLEVANVPSSRSDRKSASNHCQVEGPPTICEATARWTGARRAGLYETYSLNEALCRRSGPVISPTSVCIRKSWIDGSWQWRCFGAI